MMDDMWCILTCEINSHQKHENVNVKDHFNHTRSNIYCWRYVLHISNVVWPMNVAIRELLCLVSLLFINVFLNYIWTERVSSWVSLSCPTCIALCWLEHIAVFTENLPEQSWQFLIMCMSMSVFLVHSN